MFYRKIRKEITEKLIPPRKSCSFFVKASRKEEKIYFTEPGFKYHEYEF